MVSHIYVAARLYSALDRFAAGLLAMEIERQAARQKFNGGLKPFLPFRDTNQQAFTGDNKARAIYEADLAGMAQNLPRCPQALCRPPRTHFRRRSDRRPSEDCCAKRSGGMIPWGSASGAR